VLQALGEAEAPQQRRYLAVRVAPAQGFQQLQHGVVDGGHAGHQVEVLADEAQFGEPEVRGLALGQRGDVAPADRHGAAGGGEERGDHQQQRGLARAAGTVERDHLAGVDAQRDAVDGAYRLPAGDPVVLDQVSQFEQRGAPSSA
jgi:hypothetical protein